MVRSSSLFMKHSGDSTHLCARDVTNAEPGLTVSVTVLKTNKFMSEKILIPVPRLVDNGVLCPSTAVEKTLQLWQAKRLDFLFFFTVTVTA